MKLSISNIAWSAEYDREMYSFLKSNGFIGLEIAPSRIFSEKPYERLELAKNYAKCLSSDYNLSISSIQSILYGKNEKLFGNEDERNKLLEYTKKAIDFAAAIKCKNIVFGSPKNRVINDNQNYYSIALDFFAKLGEYAIKKETVISIEPNPVIYGTDFINLTEEAFQIVEEVDCRGFKVNVDLGAFIQNNEDIGLIVKNIDKINHVHISEPNLVHLEKRVLHKHLANILIERGYNRFVSIEMKKLDDLEKVKATILYIKEVFSCL